MKLHLAARILRREAALDLLIRDCRSPRAELFSPDGAYGPVGDVPLAIRTAYLGHSLHC